MITLIAALFWPGVAVFAIHRLHTAWENWLYRPSVAARANAMLNERLAEISEIQKRLKDVEDRVNTNSSFRALTPKR